MCLTCSRQVRRCSPDRIRTGATALRGRRPRPLDDGAVRPTATKLFVTAGVPGLEPRLAEPESAGLPITPYPIRCAHLLSAPGDDVSPCRPRLPNRPARSAVDQGSVPAPAAPSTRTAAGRPGGR